jgi:hypothetical protein
MWQRNAAGPIYGADNAGAATVALDNADRILLYSATTIGTEGALFGPYEVVNRGWYLDGGDEIVCTNAIIRRTADANTAAKLCHGMTVRVSPGAVEHGGDYFTITTADPIVVDSTVLAWSISATYAGGSGAYETLTAAQTLTEGAGTDTLTGSANPMHGGTNDIQIAPFGCATLNGTPGVASIPAGPWDFQALLNVDIDHADGYGYCIVKLWIKHADDSYEASAFLTTTSPPVRELVPTLQRWTSTLAASVTVLPTDRIEPRFYLGTTSATAQGVTLTWQDAERHTRIGTTLVMAATGTTDHRLLQYRNAKSQHIRRAVDDEEAICTSLVDGNLTPNSTANVVTIPENGIVKRIDTTQFPSGCMLLTLAFPLQGKLYQKEGDSGDFAGINFGSFGGLDDSEDDYIDFGYTGFVDLVLYEGVWHLRGAPNTGTVTAP